MLTNVSLPATAYEEVTVGATAVGLSAANYLVAERAVIRVLTNAVNVRRDGGVPTAASGLNYAADVTFTVYGQSDMANFRAVQVAGGATLCVTYEGKMR